MADENDDIEKIHTRLTEKFNELPAGERVRFFYVYAMMMLDETELRNLANIILHRLPKQ